MTTRRILICFLLAISGCSSAKIEDYKNHTPKMDMREFFTGDLEALGVFMDRSGMADPQFTCAMKGTWKGNDGTLEEHFVYSDGHKEERTWRMHFTDDNHFTATAHDVVGTAQGAQFGNAVNIRYVLRVPVKDTTYDMDMNDWMYRMDDKTILNHTTMKKLGFQVGDLFLTIRKK